MIKNEKGVIQKNLYGRIRASKKVVVAIMALFFVYTTAHAEEAGIFDDLMLGAGISYSDKGYVAYNNEISPVPMISYESKYFSIDGLSVAGNIINNKNHCLSAIVSYDDMHFDPDNVKGFYKHLDERESSILAGGVYTFTWNEIISISVKFQTDIDNKHNGARAESTCSFSIPINKIFIIPTLGVEWRSDKYNQYYYGVSSAETEKTGLNTYHPKEIIQPFAGLGCLYSLTQNWTVIADFSASYNADEIYKSPMVNKKVACSSILTLSYVF